MTKTSLLYNDSILVMPEDIERFFTKIDKTLEHMPWISPSVDKDGYGLFKVCGKMVRAHRLSYLIHNGYIDTDLLVLHTCDIHFCQDPTHLYQGDQLDNAVDAMNNGVHCHGETHGMSKLNNEKVMEIRQLYSTGRYTYKQLGEIYGVHLTSIRNVVKEYNWCLV